MATTVVTRAIGSGIGKKIFGVIAFLFKWKMLFLFMSVILIHSFVISVKSQDISAGISELGERFTTPTIKLKEISKGIIEADGFYVDNSNNIFLNIWETISTYFLYLSQLWIILMWIVVMSFLSSLTPWSSESERFKNYTGGIMLFLLFQWGYILIVEPENITLMSPILAFKEIGLAFPYVFKPFVEIVQKWFPK